MSEEEITPQSRFDEQYITIGGICATLLISRGCVLLATRKGRLPPPIVVPMGANELHLWERSKLAPIMEDWRVRLSKRRRIAEHFE